MIVSRGLVLGLLDPSKVLLIVHLPFVAMPERINVAFEMNRLSVGEEYRHLLLRPARKITDRTVSSLMVE